MKRSRTTSAATDTQPVPAALRKQLEKLSLLGFGDILSAPATPEESRERLVELAVELSAEGHAWAASSLSRYLLGECTSLDEAFGIRPRGKRGRKGNIGKAQQVHRLRKQGKSWKAIADALSADEGSLRRLYKQHRDTLQLEDRFGLRD